MSDDQMSIKEQCSDSSTDEVTYPVLVHFRITTGIPSRYDFPQPSYSSAQSSSGIFHITPRTTLVDLETQAIAALERDGFGIRTQANVGMAPRTASFDLQDTHVQWNDVHERFPPTRVRNDGELHAALHMMRVRGWRDNLFFVVKPLPV
ncbi:hypothetical protein NHQ30_009270 [Ciborinia camelliae]|nr:hypothetical protein NHQ30_009270 [Ciborinia camelliae]